MSEPVFQINPIQWDEHGESLYASVAGFRFAIEKASCGQWQYRVGRLHCGGVEFGGWKDSPADRAGAICVCNNILQDHIAGLMKHGDVQVVPRLKPLAWAQIGVSQFVSKAVGCVFYIRQGETGHWQWQCRSDGGEEDDRWVGVITREQAETGCNDRFCELVSEWVESAPVTDEGFQLKPIEWLGGDPAHGIAIGCDFYIRRSEDNSGNWQWKALTGQVSNRRDSAQWVTVPSEKEANDACNEVVRSIIQSQFVTPIEVTPKDLKESLKESANQLPRIIPGPDPEIRGSAGRYGSVDTKEALIANIASNSACMMQTRQ